MARCCLCSAKGVCRKCVCTKEKRRCRGCIPSIHGRCENDQLPQPKRDRTIRAAFSPQQHSLSQSTGSSLSPSSSSASSYPSSSCPPSWPSAEPGNQIQQVQVQMKGSSPCDTSAADFDTSTDRLSPDNVSSPSVNQLPRYNSLPETNFT